jgi:hypothetical protein
MLIISTVACFPGGNPAFSHVLLFRMPIPDARIRIVLAPVTVIPRQDGGITIANREVEFCGLTREKVGDFDGNMARPMISDYPDEKARYLKMNRGKRSS